MRSVSERIYFPGLNSLRFFAALAVIVHHVEQFKMTLRMPNLLNEPIVWSLGGQGVGLFFVLSGFLITYLLLTEVEKTGDVSTRNFYIRRILRIFPLYYLIILFSLLVAPTIMQGMGGAVGSMQDAAFLQIRDDFPQILLLNLFFLPNLGITLYPPILFASQAWSVGSEEQFYLIWPWLFRFFKKRLLTVLVLVILVKVGLTQAIIMAGTHGLIAPELAKTIATFSKLLRLEFMGIGGIAAFLLYEHKAQTDRLLRFRWVEMVSIPLLLVLMSAGAYVPHWILAVGYAWLLINISQGTKGGRSLDHPMLNHLGKLSFGIYMYHPLMILLSLWVVESTVGLESFGLAKNSLLYGSTIASSILISELSYRYFEMIFLKQKEAFTSVPSMSARLETN
jgi:peptidoglycan/LPS O-acetylase OafA/YrhL